MVVGKAIIFLLLFFRTKMNHDSDNNITFKKIVFLGFTPLVIAGLVYISLSLCIQISRCYSNYRLKQQLIIVRCSEQCLIVSNPSIDETDEQAILQIV